MSVDAAIAKLADLVGALERSGQRQHAESCREIVRELTDAPDARDVSRVAVAYQLRWEAATRCAWMLSGRHDRELRDIAKWVGAQAAVERLPSERVLAALMDRFFADPWSQGHQYPLAALAKHPGRYYLAGQPGPRDELAVKLRELDKLIDVAQGDGDHARVDALRREQYEIADRRRTMLRMRRDGT